MITGTIGTVEVIRHSPFGYDDRMEIFGADTPLSNFYKASIHASGGDIERGFRHLEQSLQTGFRDFAVLDSSPYLAPLRDDPRYAELLSEYR